MNNKICVIGLEYVGLTLAAAFTSEYNLDLINTGDTIVFDIKSIVDGRL